jgi:hypothetical protein
VGCGIPAVESFSVDSPEFFDLVDEEEVVQEGGEGVGGDCHPQVLAEEAVGFEELAEFAEEGQHAALFGEAVDEGAAWRRLYMETPLKMRALL